MTECKAGFVLADVERSGYKTFLEDDRGRTMPHTKSAAKNLRKSDRKRAYNRSVKRDVKIQVKNLEVAIAAKADGTAELTKAYSQLAKAACKGVLHAKTASRRQSRLAKRLNKAKAAVA